MMLSIGIVAVFGAALAICAGDVSAQSFEHSVAGEAKPWTEELKPNGTSDLTFILHSDLTGGERPGIFELAARQMALLRPEFVISVGDLIEGGGDRDDLISEWESFDARAALIGAPYVHVGGNHDLSSAVERAVWSERYGPPYFHFRFKDVLFLVLDTEDMTAERRETLAAQRAEAVEIYKTDGSEAFAETPYALSTERVTGAISKSQGDYFVEAVSANQDARHTFVITHKPAWEAEKTEFHRIEEALSDMPYTVFNGHEHFYEYRERFGRDYIQLATTSGEQFPDKGLSEDHIMLISVRGDEVELVNLMLEGIRDRKAEYPGMLTEPCFATKRC
ncbi:metallophosphoesterase [Tropicibacter sp. R16_0]|uniref:metallophosphoesterase family protein n=1 Tax=Tropicibacter sp. R16_0 TaxID=2821102 RepID=UPI001ADBCFE0|nr:metallophosphoesterase family protein [Tropicibacter sp. R16_0]MBO9453154.1 metallophosphoesterase [Tropicibacter sp. R16_0]